jgi:predicted dithiol-disulfide oxidoreductase (DUF899 family)
MARFVFSGESNDYQRRREDLLAAEIVLKDQVERVAALRRALPLGMSVQDYVFREGPQTSPATTRQTFVMCISTNCSD